MPGRSITPAVWPGGTDMVTREKLALPSTVASLADFSLFLVEATKMGTKRNAPVGLAANRPPAVDAVKSPSCAAQPPTIVNIRKTKAFLAPFAGEKRPATMVILVLSWTRRGSGTEAH